MDKRKGNIIKEVLFGILMLLLFLPFLQQLFGFSEEKPLKGDVREVPAPEFSFSDYFNDSLQVKTEKYLNQHFGYRNFAVRVNNQLKYSLYRKAVAKGVIIGKDGYLFEGGNITGYLGLDYLGDSIINIKTERMRAFQDSLESMGKLFTMIFAPGKGSYCHEYIPDYFFEMNKKGKTNYEGYISKASELGVKYIDLWEWFRLMKDTTTYPLYPKTGVHWSEYAEMLVLDTLVNYFESRLHKDFPDIIYDGISMEKELKGRDGDIETAMNLLFTLDNTPMPYFEYHIDQSGKKDSIRILMISDSYWWGLYGKGLISSVFGPSEFWYYNAEINVSGGTVKSAKNNLDLIETFKSFDVICILSTDYTLKDMPWGFVNEGLGAFLARNDNAETEIEKIRNEIRNSPKWLKSIEEKAEKRGIPTDSMLDIDARWIWRKKMLEK